MLVAGFFAEEVRAAGAGLPVKTPANCSAATAIAARATIAAASRQREAVSVPGCEPDRSRPGPPPGVRRGAKPMECSRRRTHILAVVAMTWLHDGSAGWRAVGLPTFGTRPDGADWRVSSSTFAAPQPRHNPAAYVRQQSTLARQRPPKGLIGKECRHIERESAPGCASPADPVP